MSKGNQLSDEALTFRFTGKEIKEDPFKPVAEVLGFVTGRDFSDYQETIDLYRG